MYQLSKAALAQLQVCHRTGEWCEPQTDQAGEIVIELITCPPIRAIARNLEGGAYRSPDELWDEIKNMNRRSSDS